MIKRNPELPLSYDRRFQVWLYSPSMSRLALRSFPDSTRDELGSIEVMFQGVEAMQLRTVRDGLVLRDATDAEAEAIGESVGGRPLSAKRRFVVLGERLRDGWVVCAWLAVAENDLDYSYMPELVAEIGLGVIGSTKKKGD